MNFESNRGLFNNIFKSQSIFIVYVIEKVSITIFNSFRLFLRLLWWSYLRIHSWLIGKNPIVKPWARRSSAFPGITTSHSFCSNSKLAWKRTARPPRGRAQPCQELTMSVSGCISSNRYVNCLNVSKKKKLIFGLFPVDPQNGNDEEAMANSQFSLDKMDEALKALIENIRHRSGLLKICKSNVTTGSSANDDSEPDIR